MVKIKKYANGIERFMSSPKGQRFFNFAYSIGAAVVIWGALFKILHLPGGSTLLCIGMGTEIAMFIITAFDRPPKEYAWEEVFPVLESRNPEERPDFAGGGGIIIGGAHGANSFGDDGMPTDYQGEPGDYAAMADGGGANMVSAAGARAAAGIPAGIAISEEDTNSLRDSIAKMAAASEQLSQMAELMSSLRETTRALNEVSSVLLNSYQAITRNSDSISQSAEGYADRMADLNRNIGGLNTIYEIQLKSISSQLESIDRVNRGLKDIRDMYEKSAAESSHYCEETEKMARYMKQLNSVYEKMITAMTVNMYNPLAGGAPAGINPFADKED